MKVRIWGGSAGKSPLIFNVGTRWRCGQPHAPDALPPTKRLAVPTEKRLSIAQSSGNLSTRVCRLLAYSLSTQECGLQHGLLEGANTHARVLSTLRTKLFPRQQSCARRQRETLKLYLTNLMSTQSALSNKFPREFKYQQRSRKCICWPF
jgi:hypothetical protein